MAHAAARRDGVDQLVSLVLQQPAEVYGYEQECLGVAGAATDQLRSVVDGREGQRSGVQRHVHAGGNIARRGTPCRMALLVSRQREREQRECGGWGAAADNRTVAVVDPDRWCDVLSYDGSLAA